MLCCLFAGWSFRRSVGLHASRPSQTVALVGVPYSEHSSWLELRQCVERLRPRQIIPTVNAATRSQQQALVDRFADLMDLSRDRGRMDFYLLAAAPGAGCLSAPAAASPAGVVAPQAAAAAAAESSAVVASHAIAPVWSGVAAPQAIGPASPGMGSPCACAPATPHARAAVAAPAAGRISAAAMAAQPAGAGSEQQGGVCAAASVEGVSTASVEVSSTTMDEYLPSQPVPPLPPPQQQQQQQQWDAFGSNEGGACFDLSSVDMQEQQRLLADAERRQRLKKSLQAAHGKAAAQKQRGRSRVLAASQGVGKRRASILSKGAHSS